MVVKIVIYLIIQFSLNIFECKINLILGLAFGSGAKLEKRK